MLFFRFSKVGGAGVNKAKNKQAKQKKQCERAKRTKEHEHGPKITNGQRYIKKANTCALFRVKVASGAGVLFFAF